MRLHFELPPQSIKLLLAQGISQICDRMMIIGVIWLVINQTDASKASWFLAFGALPHLILSYWIPTYLKKNGPLQTVLNMDVIRGFILCSVAALIYFNYLSLNLPVLLFLFLAVNIFSAFFNPAMFMLPQTLSGKADDQKKMMSIVEICFSLASTLSPVIAVYLFKTLGVQGLILINGMSYLVAWGIEKTLTENKKSENFIDTEAGSKSSVTEILKRQPIIVYMLVGFLLINLFLGPLVLLIPLFAKNVIEGGINAVATMELLLAVGTLLGGLLFLFFKFGVSSFQKISVNLVALTAAYFLFANSSSLIFCAFSLFILGLVLAIGNVQILDFFQTNSLPPELPFVMNAVNIIGTASLPISLAVFGFILEGSHFSIQHLAVAVSILSLVVAIVFSMGPHLFKFKTLRVTP